MLLKDKTILITGASSGLGEATAYKVAKEGATVILIARTEKDLKQVTETIQKNGGNAEYFVCDIQDLKQIKNIVSQILSKYPQIDILVNNAGIWTDNELEMSDPERREQALMTNALGHINMTNELLPVFKKQNSGYIFNVISTAGIGDIMAGDNKLWQTYGASKWAMTGFTKALKESLQGTKIKVTGFHPGGFDSMLYEKAGRPDPHNQPWMMKTDDVADVIVFALTRPPDVLLERIILTKHS